VGILPDRKIFSSPARHLTLDKWSGKPISYFSPAGLKLWACTQERRRCLQARSRFCCFHVDRPRAVVTFGNVRFSKCSWSPLCPPFFSTFLPRSESCECQRSEAQILAFPRFSFSVRVAHLRLPEGSKRSLNKKSPPPKVSELSLEVIKRHPWRVRF